MRHFLAAMAVPLLAGSPTTKQAETAKPVAEPARSSMQKTATGTSAYKVEGDPVKLRGSVRDYPPGPIPAGTYPIIDSDGAMLGTASCEPGKTTTIRCKNGKCTTSSS